MNKNSGFTLIEMLMAMALFALLLSVVYATMGPAGEGFARLQETRDRLEKSQWLGRQLRLDMNYISSTNDSEVEPIRITTDSRGGAAFDELWILTREGGTPSLSYVHYFIDEESGQLVRESLMAWARSSVEPLRWELGEVVSFDVELMNAQGNWGQRWETDKKFVWPKAARITIRNDKGSHVWDYPLLVGQPPR